MWGVWVGDVDPVHCIAGTRLLMLEQLGVRDADDAQHLQCPAVFHPAITLGVVRGDVAKQAGRSEEVVLGHVQVAGGVVHHRTLVSETTCLGNRRRRRVLARAPAGINFVDVPVLLGEVGLSVTEEIATQVKPSGQLLA